MPGPGAGKVISLREVTALAQVVYSTHDDGQPSGEVDAHLLVLIAGFDVAGRQCNFSAAYDTDLQLKECCNCLIQLTSNNQSLVTGDAETLTLQAVIACCLPDPLPVQLLKFDLTSGAYIPCSSSVSVDDLVSQSHLPSNTRQEILVKTRSLSSLQFADGLCVSESRGVAIVSDSIRGAFLVIDLNNDDDDDDDSLNS